MIRTILLPIVIFGALSDSVAVSDKSAAIEAQYQCDPRYNYCPGDPRCRWRTTSNGGRYWYCGP